MTAPDAGLSFKLDWTADGPFTIERGVLEMKGGSLTSTSAFADFDLVIESSTGAGKGAELVLNGEAYKIPPEKDWNRSEWHVDSKGDKHTVKTGRKLIGGPSSHAGPSRSDDPCRHHRLQRQVVHLHHEDAAGVGVVEEGRRLEAR